MKLQRSQQCCVWEAQRLANGCDLLQLQQHAERRLTGGAAHTDADMMLAGRQCLQWEFKTHVTCNATFADILSSWSEANKQLKLIYDHKTKCVLCESISRMHYASLYLWVCVRVCVWTFILLFVLSYVGDCWAAWLPSFVNIRKISRFGGSSQQSAASEIFLLFNCTCSRLQLS